MQTFDITLNLFVLGGMFVAAVLIGFLPRSHQLAKKNRQIARLEREMVQAYAEVLETQRESCELEAKIKDITNPVIAMNTKTADDPPQTPVPERDGMRQHRPAGSR